MSDDPTPEEQSLASKATIAMTKTSAMKKGLAQEKNLIAAKKKDLAADGTHPPKELTTFLQADETFQAILKVAVDDKEAILIRRYVKVIYCPCCIYKPRSVSIVFRKPQSCLCHRFLMCYLTYTNFQRQGAVCNMTAGEVIEAKTVKEYRVISVWEHKTAMSHGSARIACHVRVYQVLVDYLGNKSGADLVFTTSSGERVTHITTELEKLSEHFSKKFSVTPTMNRKSVATALSKSATEADVRASARHMTHSVDVHKSTYQQKGEVGEAVKR
jgi:hypothetical protein